MSRKIHILCLFSIAVLSGTLPACSSPHENSSRNIAGEQSRGCQGLNIPKFIDGSKYEHWHLLINKAGHKEWNGQDIDTRKLKQYIEELSEMPTSAGTLIVHLEPETSCQTILEIQEILDSSSLCSQRRCLQDRWHYKRPIVN